MIGRLPVIPVFMPSTGTPPRRGLCRVAAGTRQPNPETRKTAPEVGAPMSTSTLVAIVVPPALVRIALSAEAEGGRVVADRYWSFFSRLPAT